MHTKHVLLIFENVLTVWQQGVHLYSRERDLAGFVSQAVVDDPNHHQYLYSLPETSGITVQYIMWGPQTPRELVKNHLHEIRPVQYPALWHKSSLGSNLWKHISVTKEKNMLWYILIIRLKVTIMTQNNWHHKSQVENMTVNVFFKFTIMNFCQNFIIIMTLNVINTILTFYHDYVRIKTFWS